MFEYRALLEIQLSVDFLRVVQLIRLKKGEAFNYYLLLFHKKKKKKKKEKKKKKKKKGTAKDT